MEELKPTILRQQDELRRLLASIRAMERQLFYMSKEESEEDERPIVTPETRSFFLPVGRCILLKS